MTDAVTHSGGPGYELLPGDAPPGGTRGVLQPRRHAADMVDAMLAAEPDHDRALALYEVLLNLRAPQLNGT